jgi:hypothetical protein
VRRAFLAAAVIAVAAVYLLQRGAGMPNWPGDLDKVLAQAQAEKRPVLVFFHRQPPGDTSRRLAGATITKNAAAIQKGRFLTVRVPVAGLDSEWARKYRVKDLPTLVLLDPAGKETNRRTGFVGEAPFRQGFLDGSEIQPPPPE